MRTNQLAHPENDLPVIVIGAGPIGLAAAVQLHARGQAALVLEAGVGVGTSVRSWGHVRLFSPWRYLVDPAARRLLDAHGWRAPDPESHPTGAELVGRLLEPLAALPEVAPALRFEHRVIAVTRLGFDRLKTTGRDQAPFQVVAEGPDGEHRLLARAVIDATGTWTGPNPLGSGGVPAAGERAHVARISYRVPDVLGIERWAYAGMRTLVVGSGHSAFNAVIDLAELARQEDGGEVVWAVRRQQPGQMFGGARTPRQVSRGWARRSRSRRC
ncbi:MAG TPA: FAD-dependent oxidoreductase [Trueperaceae bacterium]|nr:FAD-dependent oxidoreductase [Trueperaceae bacterium]